MCGVPHSADFSAPEVCNMPILHEQAICTGKLQRSAVLLSAVGDLQAPRGGAVGQRD